MHFYDYRLKKVDGSNLEVNCRYHRTHHPANLVQCPANWAAKAVAESMVSSSVFEYDSNGDNGLRSLLDRMLH